MKFPLRSMLFALLALAVVVPAAAQTAPDPDTAQAAAVVKAVTFVASEKVLEVAVAVSGECVSQPLVLANPSRLVLDLAPASGIEAKAITEVNAFGMTNIRTGMFQPMIARIIFDFSADIPPYEIKKTETGFTVVFTKPEEPAAKPEAPPVKAEEKPAAPVPQFERPAPREEAAKTEWPEGFKNTTIGVFGGTYTSPSSDFQEVYGSETTIQYGLNLTRTLLNAKGFQIDASFELRTFSKTGQATMSGDEAKLVLTPVTIAGRLLYQTKYVMPFIGFGADFYNYEETSALANTTGSANGTHFQAGLYIIFPKAEFLRLKAYYKYTKVTANLDGFDIGLGGPEYGFGLVFGFNALNKAVLMF
jgi:hypothetical protein